jgi:hypothetical protein
MTFSFAFSASPERSFSRTLAVCLVQDIAHDGVPCVAVPTFAAPSSEPCLASRMNAPSF